MILQDEYPGAILQRGDSADASGGQAHLAHQVVCPLRHRHPGEHTDPPLLQNAGGPHTFRALT